MPLPKRIGTDTIVYIQAKLTDDPPVTLAEEFGELRYLALKWNTPKLTRLLDYADLLTAECHRLEHEHAADPEYDDLRSVLMRLERLVGE